METIFYVVLAFALVPFAVIGVGMALSFAPYIIALVLLGGVTIWIAASSNGAASHPIPALYSIPIALIALFLTVGLPIWKGLKVGLAEPKQVDHSDSAHSSS